MVEARAVIPSLTRERATRAARGPCRGGCASYHIISYQREVHVGAHVPRSIIIELRGPCRGGCASHASITNVVVVVVVVAEDVTRTQLVSPILLLIQIYYSCCCRGYASHTRLSSSSVVPELPWAMATLFRVRVSLESISRD